MNCFQDNNKENQLHLNTGNCPAMSEQCLTYEEEFGGVHCYFCQLLVHDKPTCCVLDAKGDVWCKSCAHRERDDEHIAIAKKDGNILLDTDPSLLTSQLEQIQASQSESPMAEPLPLLLGQPSQPSPKDKEEEAKAPNAAGRSKSYSKEEDYLIKQAWVAVSEDSQNGVGNKSEAFHQKVKEHTHALVSEHNEHSATINSNLGYIPIRNGKSIWYRWNNVIKPACSKWAGMCKLIKIKSGEDIDVVTAKRQEMCCHTHRKGKDFPHLTAYGLLGTCRSGSG